MIRCILFHDWEIVDSLAIDPFGERVYKKVCLRCKKVDDGIAKWRQEENKRNERERKAKAIAETC